MKTTALSAMAMALILCSGCGEQRESATKRDKSLPQGMSYEALDAIEHGNEAKVGKLIEKSPEIADGRDEEGKTLLYYAALHGKTATARQLLDSGADPKAADDKGLTALHCAAADGHAEIVKLLLDKGADPNAKTQDGDAPLLLATDHLKGLPKHAGCVEAAKLLIAKGADVNAKAKDDLTPLHLAAKNGHKDIAELLLAAKAEVDPRATLYQETPLHMAAVYGHQDVAELLLANKGDINAKDKHGRTPFVRARHMRHRELAEFLVDKGGTE